MRARDDTMIERPSYTRLLRQYRDQALIKIVTGVHRAGKSTLFQLFIRELKEQGIAEEQIQTLNLEVVDNEALLDYRRLYQHVKEHLAEGKQNYVFLDEIQNVPDFQKAVRSLAVRGQETCYSKSAKRFAMPPLSSANCAPCAPSAIPTPSSFSRAITTPFNSTASATSMF